jgi:uncharacterized DUF497 family protein
MAEGVRSAQSHLAEANLKKHGVDFREAAIVLDDPLSVAFPDREKLEAASCECYRTATELLKNVTRRQGS